MITLHIDVSGVDALAGKLANAGDAMAAALARALNQAGDALVDDVAELVGDRRQLAASEMKAAMTVVRADQENLSYALDARGAMLFPVSRYFPKRRKWLRLPLRGSRRTRRLEWWKSGPTAADLAAAGEELLAEAIETEIKTVLGGL
jgi:hypothetical protein